jgi:ACS family glucarate transporter-like MFS transporter
MRRFGVVFALFLVAMLTFIDRVCLSAGKGAIAADLRLSDTAMGAVFSAFALGYAIGQIPSGWFADRAGPRLALGTLVGAWSVLIALTGAVRSAAGLTGIVFIFGLAEAGAFPASLRAIANWLSSGERGRASGALFAGSRLGGAAGFPLVKWMFTRWPWRTAFPFLGAAGVSWAIFWIIWFRNTPQEAGAAPEQMPESISALRDGPALSSGFFELLRSRRMLLATVQFVACNFTFFISISWMLPYLKSHYGLTDSRAAAYAMLPLLAGALAQSLTGWAVDRIYRSCLQRWSRRLPAMAGLSLASAGVLCVTRAGTPEAAVFCLTLAAFGVDMTVGPSFVFCADIAGANTGSISAALNMLGNLGAFMSGLAFPYLYGLTGHADLYFLVAASLNGLGAICWLGMRSLPGCNTK